MVNLELLRVRPYKKSLKSTDLLSISTDPLKSFFSTITQAILFLNLFFFDLHSCNHLETNSLHFLLSLFNLNCQSLMILKLSTQPGFQIDDIKIREKGLDWKNYGPVR